MLMCVSVSCLHDSGLGYYFVHVVVVCGSLVFFFFLMIRRPPRSTQSRSSAASDVYKRQGISRDCDIARGKIMGTPDDGFLKIIFDNETNVVLLSLIHISEPTRLLSISYAVFCLKKKTRAKNTYTKTIASNQ